MTFRSPTIANTPEEEASEGGIDELD